MKKIFLLYFLLTLFQYANAQKHDYNWIFGSFTYPDEPNHNGNILSFEGDTVSIGVFEKDFDMTGYNATYSDAEGELKFWSNGCELYDPDSQIIENGDSLNPGQIYDVFCADQTSSSYVSVYQSMMCLPDLQDDSKVFVLHKSTPWDLEDPYRLYSSVIQYSNDFQSMEVIEKNTELEGNTTSGLISATKNDSLNAWWIITAEIRGTGHYLYKLNNSKIGAAVYFEEGAFLSFNNESESSSSFTPDGTKYVIYGEADGLRIYDFDRASGILSNYQFYDPPMDFEGGRVGLAFSGSGRYLYTCHFRKIYQYDMEAEDFAASRLTVADWEESFTTGFPSPFFQMQRGPDCRIYLSAQNTNSTIHVIHHPERRGTACMVQQNIEVPAFIDNTTPNFPNYRLGTAPVCDSTKVFPTELLTAVEQAAMAQNEEVLQAAIYPNPSDGNISLELYTSLGAGAYFYVYSLQGEEVYSQALGGHIGMEQIRLPDLPSGMYLYSIFQDRMLVKTDKLVLE